MEEYISTQQLVKEMTRKVLRGSKIPHSCSLPVLRKKDEKYVIALFTQLFTREQLSKQVMQRPTFWCCADIRNGDGFEEFNCKELEFSIAPYDRLYKRGSAEKAGTMQDVIKLYGRMDDIRKKYIKSGIIDAVAYRQYMDELLKIVPKGQINFYKELSKLI